MVCHTQLIHCENVSCLKLHCLAWCIIWFESPKVISVCNLQDKQTDTKRESLQPCSNIWSHNMWWIRVIWYDFNTFMTTEWVPLIVQILTMFCLPHVAQHVFLWLLVRWARPSPCSGTPGMVQRELIWFNCYAIVMSCERWCLQYWIRPGQRHRCGLRFER